MRCLFQAAAVMALLVATCAPTQPAAASTGPRTGGPVWERVPIGGSSEPFADMNGVSCASSTFCMAVGSGIDAKLCPSGGCSSPRHTAVIQRFTGGGWANESAPPLRGGPDEELTAVSCASEQFCIAVGYWTPPADDPWGVVHHLLIDIYHDGTWSLEGTSDPSGASSSALTGVSCVTTHFCKAVGWFVDQATGEYMSLAESFDGIAWSVDTTPEYASNWDSFFESVSCPSVTFCAAVGVGELQPLSAHGSAFSQTLFDDSGEPFAATFSAGSWSLSPPPVTVGGTGDSTGPLYGVSCTSQRYCAAVGGGSFRGMGYAPDGVEYPDFGRVETFDGKQWTASYVPPPSGGPDPSSLRGDQLYGVSCLGGSTCVATGAYSWAEASGTTVTGTMVTSIEGSSAVSSQPVAEGGDRFEALLGVSCRSSNACAAVGTETANLNKSENAYPFFSSDLRPLALGLGAMVPPPSRSGALVISRNLFSESDPGTGSVTSLPAGISCPPTCSAPFKNGQQVTLHVRASSDSVINLADENSAVLKCTPAPDISLTYVTQDCTTTISGTVYADFEFEKWSPSVSVMSGYADTADRSLVVNAINACSPGASSYSFVVDGAKVKSSGCEVDVPLSLGPHSVTVSMSDGDARRESTVVQSFSATQSAYFSWGVDPLPFGTDVNGASTAVHLDACASAGVTRYRWVISGSGIPPTIRTSCHYMVHLPVNRRFPVKLTVIGPKGLTSSFTASVPVTAAYAQPSGCSDLSFGADACWRIGLDWFGDAFGFGSAPMRPPDFAILEAGVGAASGSMTVTCDGNVFYGPGLSLGLGVPLPASEIVAFGYVSDPTFGEPTNAEIDSYVSGLGGSLSISAGGVGFSTLASSSSSQPGVAYFGGYTGPGISVGLSYSFADPNNTDPGTASCAGGVTSSSLWVQLANEPTQTAGLSPVFDTAAPSSPSARQGSQIYLGAPAGTFAPDGEVTVALHSKHVSQFVLAANERGKLGRKVRLPPSLPAGVHHLVLTGLAPGGESTVNFVETLPVAASSAGHGLYVVGRSGAVNPLGAAKPFPLSSGPRPTGAVGMASSADARGYWTVGRSGKVSGFGDAHALLRARGSVTTSVVAIAGSPTGKGYWLVDGAGNVEAFGDARLFARVTPARVSGRVVDIAATPDGRGYWLVNNGGSVWAFGDAALEPARTGPPPRSGVVALVPDALGGGYWVVTSAGGVTGFGRAALAHPTGAVASGTVVAAVALPNGRGYWLVNSHGRAFAYGEAAPLRRPAGLSDVVAAAGL